jgi:O-antigen/teichoic acid export membrane protein
LERQKANRRQVAIPGDKICLGRTFAGDHELDVPLIAEPLTEPMMIKYFMLVIEQAAVSGCTFGYMLFLGRVLSQSEFASIGLGFTIYLIIMVLYDTLLSVPLLTLRHSIDFRHSIDYLAALWRGHIFVISATGVVALLVWSFLGNLDPYGIVLGLEFFAAGTTSGFLRRCLHSEGKTSLSALAASAYFVIFAITCVCLYEFRLVSVVSSPVPFLFANLAYGLVASSAIPKSTGANLARDIKMTHLRIGFSILTFAILFNLTMNIYPLIFSRLGDEAGIAGFRLISTISNPFFQLSTAFFSFLLPRLAAPSFRQVALMDKLALASVIIAPAAAAVLAVPFGKPIALLMFGRRYVHLSPIIPVALAGVAASLAVNTIGLWLHAHGKLRILQITGAIQFTVTAILAWPSVASFGTLGAFSTYGLANFLSLVFVLIVLYKIYGRVPGRDKPPGS